MLNRKKGQVVTLDLIIGICIFLITIVLIYYLFSMDVTKTEEEDAADSLLNSLNGNKYFHDNEIDTDEESALGNMTCAEMKDFFNTNKNICIYITDEEGNLVELDGKNGLGCGGIKIGDVICGQSS